MIVDMVRDAAMNMRKASDDKAREAEDAYDSGNGREIARLRGQSEAFGVAHALLMSVIADFAPSPDVVRDESRNSIDLWIDRSRAEGVAEGEAKQNTELEAWRLLGSDLIAGADGAHDGDRDASRSAAREVIARMRVLLPPS